MELTEAVKGKIENYVKGNRVVLFMKGTRQSPMCGFSTKTVAALDSILPDYLAVNVLDDPDIREGIKVYGNWPTIPQLYVDGELLGGCDIVLSMLNSGELHQQLGVEAPDRSPPEITVTPEAAAKIGEAMDGHDGIGLHFQVDANWNSQFNLAPPEGHEIVAESNGLKVYMDLATAQRARGAVIDWVSTMQGEGLAIDLPEAERARAALEGALALDRETMARLEAMPKDTGLAFLCHHGNSSQGAAEYFRRKGFTDVNNVAGGINAWALEIDPSVPTY